MPSSVFLSPIPLSGAVKHALAGILISHIAHLLAVIALYHLTYELVPATDARKRAIAFTASALHIVSPAGLFLSAPYGESTFALFNFAGMLAYTIGTKCYASFAFSQQRYASRWFLLAGLSYGVATMTRSNGLFSGIPFLWDVATTVTPWRKFWRQRDPTRRKKLAMIVTSGSCVAVGFALPQIVAYKEYCMDGNTRPWCSHLPPSIYSWVQAHYWGVGFFKYWTLNNLPLFLLAAPMVVMLLWTGYIALYMTEELATLAISGEGKKHDDFDDSAIFAMALRRFALPQLVLTVLAMTSFHVQIINRISSGYAVWYSILAIAIQAEPGERPRVLGGALSEGRLKWIVRAMVMYAIVQGGLYACFLPPA